MAQEISAVSIEEKYHSFTLATLTVFSFLLWVSVTVSAAPPLPNFSDDRRSPLQEKLLDPEKEWRDQKEPKKQWRSEGPLTKKYKKQGRIENKRFKPYYYDPEKEGNTRDPYSEDKNYGSPPATLFRFQF